MLYVPEGESYRDHPQYDEVRVDPDRDAPAVEHESVDERGNGDGPTSELDAETRAAFESARDSGDLQKQVNLLYEELFGQQEDES